MLIALVTSTTLGYFPCSVATLIRINRLATYLALVDEPGLVKPGPDTL